MDFNLFVLSPVLSFQVSWLGLEENADDPCKFTLTSRSSSGNMERYTLHSASPGVSQVWVHQVSQILENQRNFLNGKRQLCFFAMCTNTIQYKYNTSLPQHIAARLGP